MDLDHRMAVQKYLIIAYNVFANIVLLKPVSIWLCVLSVILGTS